MAVMALSWQLGCRGDYIADDVANQLAYKIIGREEFHEVLVNANDQFSKDLGSGEFSKIVEGEIQPDFFFRAYSKYSTYSHLLMSLIYKAACQDNVIIKGFGSPLILASQPHVLCVRLKGDFGGRVSSIQQQRSLERRAAEKLVAKDDRDRMGFVEYLFRRELTNIQSYDMVFDIGKLSQKVITEMVVSAIQELEKIRPMTAEDRIYLETLAFESRVKAIIQKQTPNIPELNVSVNPDGIVTISGNVARKHEKTTIEQQVNSLPEVRGIVNNITVGSPFRRRKRRA